MDLRTAPARSGVRAAWACLLVVWVLWGSIYLVNRLLVTDVHPLLAAGFRFLAAGSVLAVGVLLVSGRRGLAMNRAQLGTTLLSGLMLPAWGNGLVSVAQTRVPSWLAALLLAVTPLYIVILRAVTGDRPRPATVAGVLTGLAGLALLLAGGAGSGGPAGTAWWGPWLVVVAAVGWAGGTFATTRLPVPPDPFAFTAVQTLSGGAVLVVAGFASGGRVDVAALAPHTWWIWAVAALATLGGFSAYAIALRGLAVSTVSTYAYVNPVIAVVLGVGLAGEMFTPLQAVGGAVVVLAVVLVVRAERR